MRKIVLGLIFSIFFGLNLFGNDVGLGLEAYNKGDFTKACDGGNAFGCSNLGTSYFNGEGVKQDKIKAKELFGKACDGGIEDGCKGYAILNK